MLCYSISKEPINSWGFWLSLAIEVVFILFMFSHFRDKDRYIGLNEKFDDLYELLYKVQSEL